MRHAPPGRLRTVEAFRRRWRELAPDLDCELEGADGPLGRTLEGCASQSTLRRWRRFGRSGAKCIWGGEAFAVCADGRANPNQLCMIERDAGARNREGRFGGSFEERTRLFRMIVEAIRADSPELEIATRVSLGDVFPCTQNPVSGVGAPLGWDAELPWLHDFGIDAEDPRRIDFAEPLRFLSPAVDLGIELVNVSLGSPYASPHLQRPAAYPPCDGYEPPEDPLLGVAEHIRVTRRCKAAFPELTVDVLRGQALDRKRICRTFSDCTTAPRNGLPSGCYPLHPYYKAQPAAARLKALKAERD